MLGAEEMFEAMWDGGEQHPEASFDEIAGELSQERRALMGGTRRWNVRSVGRRRNRMDGARARYAMLKGK